MSIQIAGGSHPAARAEVVERFGKLVASIKAQFKVGECDPDTNAQDEYLIGDEVRSMFFALVGGYPTGDEMAAMGCRPD